MQNQSMQLMTNDAIDQLSNVIDYPLNCHIERSPARSWERRSTECTSDTRLRETPQLKLRGTLPFLLEADAQVIKPEPHKNV